MKVLVVTPFYLPDLGPSAALYAMLCEDLVRLGCEVSVISAVPHYPTGRVADGFRGRIIQRESVNGVDVTRVWVPSLNRARLGQRLVSFACYQALAAAVGWARRFDVLMASNPALEVMLPFLTLGVIRKPIVFSVHEIYPEVGIKLGVFRSGAVARIVNWMERFCSKRAAFVRVLSESYRRSLAAKGVPESKLTVIGDWVDTDFIHLLPRHNAFSSRWGLDGSFVAMYGGNLGLTQGLESVVEAARQLAGNPSIRIVFVGDGPARPGLEHAARSARLTNVQFIPFQPRELLPLVLASADVSLLTLKRGLGADSVPSKCYSMMASGRPVLAAVDPGSDTWDLVQQAGCGACVESEDPGALADAILGLYRDEARRARLGGRGRDYVVERHSRAIAAQKFYELARSLGADQEAPLTEAVTHG